MRYYATVLWHSICSCVLLVVVVLRNREPTRHTIVACVGGHEFANHVSCLVGFHRIVLEHGRAVAAFLGGLDNFREQALEGGDRIGRAVIHEFLVVHVVGHHELEKFRVHQQLPVATIGEAHQSDVFSQGLECHLEHLKDDKVPIEPEILKGMGVGNHLFRKHALDVDGQGRSEGLVLSGHGQGDELVFQIFGNGTRPLRTTEQTGTIKSRRLDHGQERPRTNAGTHCVLLLFSVVSREFVQVGGQEFPGLVSAIHGVQSQDARRRQAEAQRVWIPVVDAVCVSAAGTTGGERRGKEPIHGLGVPVFVNASRVDGNGLVNVVDHGSLRQPAHFGDREGQVRRGRGSLRLRGELVEFFEELAHRVLDQFRQIVVVGIARLTKQCRVDDVARGLVVLALFGDFRQNVQDVLWIAGFAAGEDFQCNC
mmetsp:Transcript_7436/g.21650  ORF Transcript_7436/g.21650 Transcript_7436/m.21650 type:complete len:424 (-) Transcript_7436:93-1364(-)